MYMRVHAAVYMYNGKIRGSYLCFIQHLSKSHDLRVLIARKKGERSALPTYVSSSRHSVSEEESGGEEDMEEGGRKGGVSSVIKIPER